MHNNHIVIWYHFPRELVDYKDTGIKYIRSEENTEGITTENCPEADYVKRMKRIMEGELWEIMETGRNNFNDNGVVDGVMYYDSTEYSSHALAEVVDG